jgi:hypothetical protein
MRAPSLSVSVATAPATLNTVEAVLFMPVRLPVGATLHEVTVPYVNLEATPLAQTAAGIFR